MFESVQSIAQSGKTRLNTGRSLLRFLWQNKMWWLIPMFLVLVGGFIFLFIAESSPLGPFIYTLF